MLWEWLEHICQTLERNIEMKGIMQYPKAMISKCIWYGSQDLSVKSYTNLDYLEDLDKKRSTLIYITLIGGAMSWQSQLQACVTQTTIKAKYVAIIESWKRISLAWLIGGRFWIQARDTIVTIWYSKF